MATSIVFYLPVKEAYRPTSYILPPYDIEQAIRTISLTGALWIMHVKWADSARKAMKLSEPYRHFGRHFLEFFTNHHCFNRRRRSVQK